MARHYRKKVHQKHRRKYGKRKTGKPSRGLKQSVYFFKRKWTQFIDLNAATLPTGWIFQSPPSPLPVGTVPSNGYVISWKFTLAQLSNHKEFTSGLFNQYKICAVKTQCYCTSTIATGQAGQNSNMIIQTLPWNQSLSTTPTLFTEEKALETQSCKRTTLIHSTGKPKSFYMKLKQSTDSTGPGGQQLYLNPRWTDVDNPDVPHYGLNQRFSFVNYTLPQQQPVAFKIVHTYYLAMKGVV